MQIRFDELKYQNDAVNAAVDLFKGQALRSNNHLFGKPGFQSSLFAKDGVGIGNNISVSKERLLKNLQQIQIRNGIAPDDKLVGENKRFPQFNIEMETGTGKTFVYLKTILELNKQYGYLKFIVVVPSVAIREGVIKSIQMTRGYFSGQYDGEVYEAFVYSSSDLNRIREFAIANTLQIMITTIQAFNKDSNVMNQQRDQLDGERPIDFLAETRPILIVDEPQSVDATDLAKKAINSLNPSVAFCYSATHKENYSTIYRLGPVEAYDQQLVKQVEVAALQNDEDGNRAYLRLISVANRKGRISARIEVYKKTKEGADKKVITVQQNSDIVSKTKLQIYSRVGFVTDIDTTPGLEAVYFTGEPRKLTLSYSDEEDEAVKREQIKQTIREHLEKELRFQKAQIPVKVLSLFFLDKVENYRKYDENGKYHRGRYAHMFEDEYRKLIKSSRYQGLRDASVPVNEVHDGYFSRDGKNHFKNTRGNTMADESTYSMIMRDKEGLLTSYDPGKGNTDSVNKLRFIFSHSALREGWDNPNIFQICTLVDTQDTMTKRQKIGRGLRIAVDQDGHRVPGFEINTLTIMANESYKNFAETLQTEYADAGVKFGIFTDDVFAAVVTSVDDDTGEQKPLGKGLSRRLIQSLIASGYLTAERKATNKLVLALQSQSIVLPNEFSEYQDQILAIATKYVKSLQIYNRADRKLVSINKGQPSEDFKGLWDRIKSKTTYRVNFDTDKLIDHSVRKLQNITTHQGNFTYTKAQIVNTIAGFEVQNPHGRYTSNNDMLPYELPDILTFLQNETHLTRRTLAKILRQVDDLTAFQTNPQSCITQAAKLINWEKQQLMVAGIEYKENGAVFEQSLFSTETLYAYLDHGDLRGNAVKVSSNKTIYNYIVTDSETEKQFARDCEQDDNVLFYIKMPAWFKVPTPLGTYNPDWAVIYKREDGVRLYFVADTKANPDEEALRGHELLQIKSGRAHFRSLKTGIIFDVIKNEKSLLSLIQNFKTD
ncbi:MULTISPECIES: restriction endonuclease [Lacticaseibacillus]|uniref:DEAD/DEAH box helicase family protein n=1 Tax=Lacticaseibacillus huelsenbergensis TaxID=3035291 RepID=A0ABY8DU56_9LACO|nr:MULTISPECIES: DEAD/DEAH box helicase family protein [Lacticaseibacillus]MDG3060948.1 DEAD/DEAH box helicase family protein [Lacticaseibacillus sp. BCRC 81376]WFB39487.1 DEAD/DEAH box helicase family protein [Lacticaseibacillus huelsenbergensis]